MAAIAGTCAILLHSHVGSGAFDAAGAIAASAPTGVSAASFSERFAVATFSERFAVAGSLPAPAATGSLPKTTTRVVATAPSRRNVYQPLLDPTYSLGAPSATFAQRLPAQPGPRIAALPDRPAIAEAKFDAKFDAKPDLRSLVEAPPQPKARPSDLQLAAKAAPAAATGHEALVARARAVVAATSRGEASIFDKLFGRTDKPAGVTLAYAGTDGGVLPSGESAEPTRGNSYDRYTAVYDITARKVFMPDGSKLEAHSGLGAHLDRPEFAHLRMRGVTPPHVYDLKPREALFHGVAALRLTPVGGEGAIFGRTGLLAHTYMLGPNGDSNGCVSFKNYDAFLRAYRNGEIKQLIVVAKL